MESTPVGAALIDLPCDRDQRGSNVGGSGRTAVLVRYYAQYWPLGCKPQHGLHEVCPIRAIDPGGGQDEAMRHGRQGMSTVRLIQAISGERSDRIVLKVACR